MVKDCKVLLNDLGELITSCWLEIPHHYNHASIDLIAVVPNHFHGILLLDNYGRGTTCRAPTEEFGDLPGEHYPP